MPSQLVPIRIDPADLAACKQAIRNGSKSFYAASLILPRRVREPALALYAFCRLADDLVDLDDPGLDGLARLTARLDRIYEGRPLPVPADRAMAEVVERFEIPKTLPAALLDGFLWDAETRRYETLNDLCAYAARVAGAVGAMMACLMDARSAQCLARATDLGAAMQLTNIARDVGEDARAGRLYLPLAWLREAGIDPEAFLADPRPGAPIAAVTERLLDAARQFYRRAESGIDRLPSDCRPAIRAAHFIYAEIGNEIARSGHDSVSRRAVVPTARKIALLGRASLPTLHATDLSAPPHPANAFLVEAAVQVRPRWVRDEKFGERIGRVAELFMRLEQEERVRRNPSALVAGKTA